MKILLYDAENSVIRMRYPQKFIFEELGHSVDIFDWSYYFSTKSKGSIGRKLFDRIFVNLIQKKINEDLLVAASKGGYDLLFIMMGKHIYPETLLQIKEYVKLLAIWSTDDIYNMRSSSFNVIKSIPHYDLIFSPRLHLFDEFKKLGSESVKLIDWYPHPELMDEARETLVNNHDFSFVGSWSSYREDTLTPLLCSAHRLGVYGWGWEHKVSRKFKGLGLECNSHVPLLKMREIFQTSKININILTRENRDTSNLRNFEIPASKSFQLAERSDHLLNLFEEEKEIVCFSGIEELKSKCDFYLKNDTARERIAQAGYKRLVKGSHTLKARLKLVIDNVNQLL